MLALRSGGHKFYATKYQNMNIIMHESVGVATRHTDLLSHKNAFTYFVGWEVESAGTIHPWNILWLLPRNASVRNKW